MKRRTFLKGGGLAVAATTLAKPAIARAAPELRWRLVSSFPGSLDIIFGSAQRFARYVSEATDGRFVIEPHPAGAIVPPFGALDAVADGRVECAQTPTYFYADRNPTLAFGTGIPFGLNARHQHAWWQAGGGEIVNEALHQLGVHAIVIGNSGTQMGGWFRKEIRTVDDLRGLKFRIGGMGGQILARLGVEPQQMPPNEVLGALERGTLDATEFVGPYDDEKLGFYRVAKHYYCPGWWEGGGMLHLLVKLDKWQELPKSYQSILLQAGEATTNWMLARYDVENPAALRRLEGAGVIVKAFPDPVIEACWKAAKQHYAELSANNATFRKALDSHNAFQTDALSYWRIAEHPYDSMMLRLLDS
jgi:TRAP-type mannitol/chloroaromatic compound transport system substrate-binding protein|nr:MAG: ABC transporter substrate-binding protein [Pseudomonadota bacterium]